VEKNTAGISHTAEGSSMPRSGNMGGRPRRTRENARSFTSDLLWLAYGRSGSHGSTVARHAAYRIAILAATIGALLTVSVIAWYLRVQ
jgi:hypothetical protein